jgi:hypothetical protein
MQDCPTKQGWLFWQSCVAVVPIAGLQGCPAPIRGCNCKYALFWYPVPQEGLQPDQEPHAPAQSWLDTVALAQAAERRRSKACILLTGIKKGFDMVIKNGETNNFERSMFVGKYV